MPELTQTLQEFLTTQVFAFMLTFARLGSAIMILPGIGDSFVSTRVRLLAALAMTFVLFPLIVPYLPAQVPPAALLVTLIFMEVIVGLFFGSIARALMAAMDIAGMVVSMQSGLANAQIFNPAMASQGSLIGAFFSVTGVTLLLVTDLHHLMFTGLVESYELFPLGEMPDTGSMAEFFTLVVVESFATGIKIAAPFIVITLLVYVGMGVLTRLMPQIQVFILLIPAQILIALTLLMITMTSIFMYFIAQFENGMVFFLSNAGG